MEPITLFAIYTFGLIIGGVGFGYYLESRSKDYYQKLQQYVDNNFVLRFFILISQVKLVDKRKER